jgi:hypothetical protein
MNLTLNIESEAREIIFVTKLRLFFKKALRGATSYFVSGLSRWFLKKSLSRHDAFILTLEGLEKHIPDFSVTAAQELLNQVKIVISRFDDVDESLRSLNYFNSTSLKEKYKYTLKLLFRLEAKLHVVATKDVPIERIDGDLKEAIVRKSQTFAIEALEEK